VNKAVVIEDVVNAVASHENDSIKEVQKIAQLKKSSEGKALCELARTVVKECNKKVVIEINNIREEMKSGGAAAKKELEDLERYLRRLKSEVRAISAPHTSKDKDKDKDKDQDQDQDESAVRPFQSQSQSQSPITNHQSPITNHHSPLSIAKQKTYTV